MHTSKQSRIGGVEWFAAFRKRYNEAAGSLMTELGLFYDRHRKFEDFGVRSDPRNPEYTDQEWNRVMADFFAQMAEERGLIQASDPERPLQLVWNLPGVLDRPTVLVRETGDATETILTRDLPDVTRSAADLSVLTIYPDYPCPFGTSTIDEATRAWNDRIAARLNQLQPPRELMVLTISAYSFELPAPWRAFLWDPTALSLHEAK